MFTKKQTTTNSFIIYQDHHPFGFLLTLKKVYLYTQEDKFEFDTLEEMNEVFGEIPQIENFVSKNFIDKYPIKHNHYEQVKQDEYITYSTGGNIRFAAGWWIIKTKNWGLFQSPKLSTVLENEAKGPYSDKMVAQKEMALL